MIILLTVHSITRWLVILSALLLIIRLISNMVKKRPFDRITSTLNSAFSGLMDIQMMFGFLFFVLNGFGSSGFPPYRWEHVATMLLAVITAHLPALWTKQADSARTRNTLIAISISLLLIFVGMRPLGGWIRWWHITGLF